MKFHFNLSFFALPPMGHVKFHFNLSFFALSPLGHVKFHFNLSFFALSPMGHVKFHFKSEQIILNYIMLEPKIKFNDKKTKIYDFFSRSYKIISVSNGTPYYRLLHYLNMLIVVKRYAKIWPLVVACVLCFCQIHN